MPSQRWQQYNRRFIDKMRAWFAAQLPLPCWRCGVLIHTGEAWDVGHRTPLAFGGSNDDVWVEHRFAIPGVCAGNQNEGGRTRQRRMPASREW